jgi:outer membrane beta-barrel protein
MPRNINIFICLFSLGVTANCFGENDEKRVKIIEPTKTTTNVQVDAIDTEHFEIGPYMGLLSVEEFNTNIVTGISFTYHISHKFMSQINYALSSTQSLAFEEIGASTFLSKKDRDFEYINILGGYNLLDGRSFLGKNYKFNSAIYLLAGAATVNFAGEKKTGLVIGASYRAVITDWITVNLDFHDTRVARKFLDNEKITNNTEMLLGINMLF